MKKVFILLFLCFQFYSCQNKKAELKKFDANGKLIVYSEEVYANMWMKNRNLDVTVIDTFCINQKARALSDIKNGKLIYFGYAIDGIFKKLSKKLSKYGIETKEHLSGCTRMGSFEPYCYQIEMWKEIDRKYGENFIDSLSEEAKKEFIIENPNVKYMEDGKDLREKYLPK
ncbi:hypothetical protein IRZ71_15510 [Flavobacterium sp. ANB]|uniref:hypothetical protein n=1 Tax=unclassified Flavobacterium TaxID=196869 RepID=UPI0012B7BA70|nr:MULTISPECIES: hypothetical protein [unclassified Flavobacterium]MBF4517771.1 hypothetical protein [Flavobacterium sp. ANB]MTD70498.1 hypothetical protein [Flavobacterium sp. LC2016-13]